MLFVALWWYCYIQRQSPDEYFLKEYQIYKGKDKFKNNINGTQIHLNKDQVDEKDAN